MALASTVCNANSDTSSHYGGGHLPQITRYLALQTLRVLVCYPPPPLRQHKYTHWQKTDKNVKEWYETDNVTVNTNMKFVKLKLINFF